ncbi:type II toxin-antitoxin system PemK/MazF family toxin [Candidatus Binatia bacterium]|nr:type II toxin-antitoxin system PemK/MazF family toxin [Candidatus Binatia bacterium]
MAARDAVIRQGDVFWVRLGGTTGSEPWGRRPAVVLQHDRFNQTKLNTVVVLAITTNLELAAFRGNVRLRKGEANLRKASVVNVTQIQTIDRERLEDKIGSLTRTRLREIWRGVLLVVEVNGNE